MEKNNKNNINDSKGKYKKMKRKNEVKRLCNQNIFNLKKHKNINIQNKKNFKKHNKFTYKIKLFLTLLKINIKQHEMRK